MSISDIDDCTPGQICENCQKPATTAIEWEDAYGRRWATYCDHCAEEELASSGAI